MVLVVRRVGRVEMLLAVEVVIVAVDVVAIGMLVAVEGTLIVR